MDYNNARCQSGKNSMCICNLMIDGHTGESKKIRIKYSVYILLRKIHSNSVNCNDKLRYYNIFFLYFAIFFSQNSLTDGYLINYLDY